MMVVRENDCAVKSHPFDRWALSTGIATALLTSKNVSECGDKFGITRHYHRSRGMLENYEARSGKLIPIWRLEIHFHDQMMRIGCWMRL